MNFQNSNFNTTFGAITPATLGSLAGVLLVMVTSYVFSNICFPRHRPIRARILFIWHAFDAGIHIFVELPWLYHTFFSWVAAPKPGENATSAKESFTMPGVYFLGHKDRLYGIQYASSPWASLWKEYAKADRRVSGADPVVVCLELICVFIMTPLAIHICYLLWQGKDRRAGFWMTIVAACELCMGKSKSAAPFASGQKLT